MNWPIERLTETTRSSGQLVAAWQALFSTHSPIGAISRSCSASGMNSSGEIASPRASLSRNRASNPLKVSLFDLKIG